MAINYSIAQMKNPNDKGAPAKYYAKAQASGSVDINELAEETLTPLQHVAFVEFLGEPGE